MKHICQIVGSFYYPPAKAILDTIPAMNPLWMLAEPDNPHDPNAIGVWIDVSNLSDIVLIDLDARLKNHSMNLDKFVSEKAWKLGHLSREDALRLRNSGFPANRKIHGEFHININGKFCIRFEL